MAVASIDFHTNPSIESIVKLIKKNELVFFVGAGISLSHNGLIGLPNGVELKEKINDSFFASESIDWQENHTFKELAQIAIWKSNNNRFLLDNFLQKVFDNVEVKPLQRHHELAKLGVDIISTNYDTLLEQAYRTIKKKPTVLYKDTQLPTYSSPLIIKIHGCVSEPNTCIITDDDYFSWFERNPELVSLLKTIFVTKTICFIGYSLSDFNFKLLLHNIRAKFGRFHRQSFFIAPSAQEDNYNFQYLEKSLGIKPIIADATDFLTHLNIELGNNEYISYQDQSIRDLYFHHSPSLAFDEFVARKIATDILEDKADKMNIDSRILEKIRVVMSDTFYEIIEKDEFLYVPKGQFIKGGERRGNEQIKISTTNAGVYFCKYAVSNKKYIEFLKDIDESNFLKFSHPQQPKEKRSYYPKNVFSGKMPNDYFENELYHDYPVVNVDWWDAYAYCRWAGGRLPTETEWEKAARGIDGRRYSWGDIFDSSKVNTSECGLFMAMPCNAYELQPSPYGIVGMAGNVWEWCSDKMFPLDENANAARIVKGGSFSRDERRSRCAFLNCHPANESFQTRGFRLVKDII